MFGVLAKLLASEKSAKIEQEPAIFPLDDLPSLVIERVLDCLSYRDLFSLRRTCKRWKSTVDRRKFRKLLLFVDAYPSPKRLFYTNEPVYYSHSLRVTDLAALKSPSFQRTFTDLHSLAIFFDSPTIDNLVSHLAVDLDALNCYRQLRFLQIDLVGFVRGHLKLDQLNVCFLKARLESNFSLAGCCQLEALAVLEFARPDPADVFKRLTYLYLDSLLDLREFQSLRVLCFGMLSTLEKVLDEFQSGQLSLPALSEIRLLDWASCYFERSALVERLQAFEENERTKDVRIFLGDRPISAAILMSTLRLVRSFDSKTKYFGAVLTTDYLTFLYRNADELSVLFPFVRKLIIDQDVEFRDQDRRIRELRLENLEMLVLSSRFADAREQSELATAKHGTSPFPVSSYASGRSSPIDERPTEPSADWAASYGASELFFRFWIKRWPRIRYLELRNYFSQTDFDSLACLLNLKNLTLTDWKP